MPLTCGFLLSVHCSELAVLRLGVGPSKAAFLRHRSWAQASQPGMSVLCADWEHDSCSMFWKPWHGAIQSCPERMRVAPERTVATPEPKRVIDILRLIGQAS